MGFVGGGEGSELVLRQFELGGLDRVLDVMRFGGADDWSGDSWLMEEPGERNLGVWEASFFRYLGYTFNDLEIVFFVVQTVSEFIRLRADRFAFIF